MIATASQYPSMTADDDMATWSIGWSNQPYGTPTPSKATATTNNTAAITSHTASSSPQARKRSIQEPSAPPAPRHAPRKARCA